MLLSQKFRISFFNILHFVKMGSKVLVSILASFLCLLSRGITEDLYLVTSNIIAILYKQMQTVFHSRTAFGMHIKQRNGLSVWKGLPVAFLLGWSVLHHLSVSAGTDLCFPTGIRTGDYDSKYYQQNCPLHAWFIFIQSMFFLQEHDTTPKA